MPAETLPVDQASTENLSHSPNESSFTHEDRAFLQEVDIQSERFREYDLEKIAKHVDELIGDEKIDLAGLVERKAEFFALAGRAIELVHHLDEIDEQIHPNQYVTANALVEGTPYLDPPADLTSEGEIAELRSGEGKTFAIGIATVFQALTRESVHIWTRDDYLAKNGAKLLGAVYKTFGLKVGVLEDRKNQYIYDPNEVGKDPKHFPHLKYIPQDDNKPYEARREIYDRCDIIYGTSKAFGFDELLDNLTQDENQKRQVRQSNPKPLKDEPIKWEKIKKAELIIDEADEIMIDDARQELILSIPEELTEEEDMAIRMADDLAKTLIPAEYERTDATIFHRAKAIPISGDYEVFDVGLNPRISFTQEGLEKIYKKLGLLEEEYEDPKDREQALTMADEIFFKPGSLLYQRITNATLARAKIRLTDLAQQELDALTSDLTQKELDATTSQDPNAKIGELLLVQDGYYHLFQRGRDYFITTRQDDSGKEGITLIDRVNGYPLHGMVMHQGMHQALEAKEGLRELSGYTRVVDKISIPALVRSYEHSSGTTGTAKDVADQLWRFYNKRVKEIPPNSPSKLEIASPDIQWTKRQSMYQMANTILAMRDYITKHYKIPQGETIPMPPHLIMLNSTQDVEQLASIFESLGIQTRTLTVENLEEQADVIEHAGELGAITITTFLAGRGVDTPINPGKEPVPADGETSESPNYLARHAQWRVLNEMGLQVFSDFPADKRAMLQLAYRTARQGMPGTYRIFGSYESDAILQFGQLSFGKIVKKTEKIEIDDDQQKHYLYDYEQARDALFAKSTLYLSDSLQVTVDKDEVRERSRQMYNQIRAHDYKDIYRDPANWFRTEVPKIVRKHIEERMHDLKKIVWEDNLDIAAATDHEREKAKQANFNRLFDEALLTQPYNTRQGLPMVTAGEINIHLLEQARTQRTAYVPLSGMSEHERARVVETYILDKLSARSDRDIDTIIRLTLDSAFNGFWESHLLELEEILPTQFLQQRPLDAYTREGKNILRARLGRLYDTLIQYVISPPQIYVWLDPSFANQALTTTSPLDTSSNSATILGEAVIDPSSNTISYPGIPGPEAGL